MSFRPYRTLALSFALAFCTSLISAEEVESSYIAVTATDPGIEIEELDIIAAPLTVDELKTEADAWKLLVKDAAHKVAEAKLRIRREDAKKDEAKDEKDVAADQAEAAPASETSPQTPEERQAQAELEQADQAKEGAMDELTRLRSERNALIERMDVILERINQKIGLGENGTEQDEVLVYRRYIDAVGGIKLDVSDAESAYASISGWLVSEDGGLRWAKNVGAFVVIIIGFALVGAMLSRATRKALTVGGNTSALLEAFLVNSVRRIVLAVGLIVALSAIGINIGPLLAVIGAAGFVVAFALQSTLSNFASGIMILLYRPFDVNDVVEVAGIAGTVKAMNLVSTTVHTFDNKQMVVPNNEIWGNIITNATGSTERRVDMVFGIGYDDDIAAAKGILEEIVTNHPLTLENPAPVVQLHELGDSSVNFVCRPWTKTGDYWTVYWDVTRSVKERFDEQGISIPFPQRDVHVYQETPAPALPGPDTSDSGKQTSASRATDRSGLDDPSRDDA